MNLPIYIEYVRNPSGIDDNGMAFPGYDAYTTKTTRRMLGIVTGGFAVVGDHCGTEVVTVDGVAGGPFGDGEYFLGHLIHMAKNNLNGLSFEAAIGGAR